MGLQHRYNEAMAQQNQQRNKEMWDYTNFENQRAHLENAGLSVGLMYGQGGAGGASTSGGQGQGTGNPGTNAVGMGLQLKQIEAQNRLANAEATKTIAGANKIAGVDTEGAKLDNERKIS